MFRATGRHPTGYLNRPLRLEPPQHCHHSQPKPTNTTAIMKIFALATLFLVLLTHQVSTAEAETNVVPFLDRQPTCSCRCFIRRRRRIARRICRLNSGNCMLMRCFVGFRRGLKCCPIPDPVTPSPVFTSEPPPMVTSEPPPMVTSEPTPLPPVIASVSIGGGGAPRRLSSSTEPEASECPGGEQRFTIGIQIDTAASQTLYSVMICAADLPAATAELQSVLDDVNDFYERRMTMRARPAMRILVGTLEDLEPDLTFTLLGTNPL